MPTVRWRGDAPAVSQESRATPANVEVGDLFRLTVNGKSVSYTAAAATVADVVAGLTAAWNASTVFEHAEITAANAGGYVELTGDKPGVPFIVTANTIDGGGANTQTLAITTPLGASGPHVWSTPANWSTGSAPATGDDVFIEQSSVSILYGLDQAAVQLTSLNIAQSFTGAIGLPRTSPAGYIEYREQYLKIQATRIVVGQGEGAGSGRIKVDTVGGQTTLDVLGSGPASDANVEAVQWKGTHAGNVVNLSKGSLGIATAPGETATVATLRVGYRNNPAGDAVARVGSGVALTNLEQTGGQVALAASVATVEQSGGELVVADGSIATLYLDGGALRFESTGMINTAHVGERATLDFSRDLRERAVANCNLYAGGRLLDPFGTVTFTTGIHLVRTTLAAVNLEVGADRVLTLSS